MQRVFLYTKEGDFMPPNFKFTREQIISASLEIAREEGMEGITARAVGKKLDSSSKVIFSLFRNMEDLQRDVVEAAYQLYLGYLREDVGKGEYPPYKATGMGYVRFAKEEKELFKILFLAERSKGQQAVIREDFEGAVGLVQDCVGLDDEAAAKFHMEMWIFVHGIASMLATSYLDLDDRVISDMISDVYRGLRAAYCIPDGGDS